MMSTYSGRVGIVQRVLPRYRAPFFDLLAAQCSHGLAVFAGAARASESIPLAENLDVAEWTYADNLHLFGGRFYLCLQRGLLPWLERANPDVLVVEANPRYLSTAAALRWMHARKRPVIGWGLGAPVTSGLRQTRRHKFLSQFDALIAYSERGAAEYRATGFPADKIFVAPNAVAPRPQGNLPARPAGFVGQPALLYVGRLQARKRLDSLIRACASLPNKPRLVIVGDGPERGALQNLAAAVYPQTEFRGALFGAELDAAFDEADLFVLPGTGGLAIQQAMAHGLPVMVAEGDGSQDGMVTPGNGWLLPPNDENALRTALTEALSDPARLRKMGQESFRLVTEEFNLENMADAFVNALNQVKR
jgi:glycosyltransferase involved in cell wall biosynthesis